MLQGSLSDEHGDYPAGTYLLNPPGFRHAPFSNRSCIIFVELRQYGGERREHVVVDTKSANWTPGPVPGVDLLPLYHNARHPETMELLHFSGCASLPHHDCPGGTVIDGTGTPPQADAEAIASFDDLGRLPEGLLPAWIRRRTSGPLDRVETANLRRVAAHGITVAAGLDAGNLGTLHGPAPIRSSRSRSWR